VVLLSLIPASMLLYNEILYFTDWKDNATSPNNHSPIHFYVVNLDRQPERFVKFQAQANKFDINVTRITATDGYKVIFVDRASNEVFTGTEVKNKFKEFLPQHKYDVYCTQESYVNQESAEFVYNAFADLTRALTAGEIGLTCSYRLLWRQIANAPDEQIAVIFEDDAVIAEDFNQNFKYFITTLPSKWDIAYLDADVIHRKNHFPYSVRWRLHLPDLIVNNYLIKIHNETNVERTHGYVIHKASAQKLLNAHDNDTSGPIDYTIAKSIQERVITAYIAQNKLVSYDELIESEISTMGRKEFGN
jgi:GR25 family glycosyltransferase involved in LPS biosynthesis